ncbi:hypothetical protein [Brachybacterium vulturis]|uniref:hypothetical protein n=1 Tax=Brachybacterium vulturis TaxID=2017484 RepID=UPI0012FE41AE|nr:hypothetical protein [Brachybacterium vulturis]
MTRLEQLREQWAGDLARLEDGYAEALETGADQGRVAQLEGMIAAYQQTIRDAA